MQLESLHTLYTVHMHTLLPGLGLRAWEAVEPLCLLVAGNGL